MKKKLFLILFCIVLFSSCTNDDGINTVDKVSLENSTWKLKKEIWTFPNGNTETYIENSGSEDRWSFINSKDLRLLFRPYEYQINGRWSQENDILTFEFRYTDVAGQIIKIDYMHYKIIELTNVFMKVDCLDISNAESSENGKPSHIYYELAKE